MLDNKNLKNFHILEQYEDFMSTSKVYGCLPIIYPILGMNGEAGEAAAAAAAAKSFQSCPSLCDPMDGSPPGPAVPGVL